VVASLMVAPMIRCYVNTQVPFVRLVPCDCLPWITTRSDKVQKVNLLDRTPISSENWQGWGKGYNHKRDLGDLGDICPDPLDEDQMGLYTGTLCG